MKYITFSFAELEKLCIKEAERIKAEENIDLIIFVAKAALPIALYMSRIFNCRIMPIYAERKRGWLNIIKKYFFKFGGRFIPEGMRECLRWLEVKSGFHKRNPERYITFDINITDNRCGKTDYRKILVVDDSVDTGATLSQVLLKVKQVFPNSEIYSYGLNVFGESAVKPDFFTLEDRMIRTPASKDSEEYDDFLLMCRDYGIIDCKK